MLNEQLDVELASRVSGSVLSPEDPGYDEARAVHNGLVDRRPARHRPLPERPPTWSPRSRSRAARDSRSRCAAAGTMSPGVP